ncbi:hypothetical protein [Thermococcus henrietii]|uniref:hypothetical protein n=1 Tax=Thermococcus henrietii TaxID=2016361 RepID=UPI000C0808BB|nr:hypothetical protein [Thermococcus henrietii]
MNVQELWYFFQASVFVNIILIAILAWARVRGKDLFKGILSPSGIWAFIQQGFPLDVKHLSNKNLKGDVLEVKLTKHTKAMFPIMPSDWKRFLHKPAVLLNLQTMSPLDPKIATDLALIKKAGYEEKLKQYILKKNYLEQLDALKAETLADPKMYQEVMNEWLRVKQEVDQLESELRYILVELDNKELVEVPEKDERGNVVRKWLWAKIDLDKVLRFALGIPAPTLDIVTEMIVQEKEKGKHDYKFYMTMGIIALMILVGFAIVWQVISNNHSGAVQTAQTAKQVVMP